MNSNYYQNSVYTGNSSPISYYEASQQPNHLESMYIDYLLKVNNGKKAKLYVNVPGSSEWQDRVFEGIIEKSGKDYVVVSNPNTGEWYLILLIYLNFVTFEEPIIMN